MTHYERLGVRPTATAAEIRDAYRAAARAAHPDRNGEGSSTRMAAINESYRVLRDPDRRRSYDAVLASSGAAGQRTSAARTSAPSTPRPPAPRAPQELLQPARFPWRFMAVLLVLGVGVVALGVVFAEPSAPTPIDNILRADDCVQLSESLEAREVRCDEPHDATVRLLIPFDRTCPTGTEPYRDRQGMGTACVVRTDPTVGVPSA